MTRREQYPPHGFWLRMGTHGKRLATVLRTQWLLDGATNQENPGRLTWATSDTVDGRKRLAMQLFRVSEARKALATALEEISPGDFLENAPNGLREVARKAKVFRPDLRETVLSLITRRGESTARPVTGWGYEAQLAVAELRELSETIGAALPAESLISLRDVQRLEYAADSLLAAASEAQGKTPETSRRKKSTVKGEARDKIIAALSLHHKYQNGSCLNLEPIGNNALARLADVDPSTASTFFNNEFNKREKGGYAMYRAICRDAGRSADSLKALRGEFSPHDLYGRRPPGEGERDEE